MSDSNWTWPQGTAALVTGGAGFIGGHIVEALLARGVRVRILDDFSTGKPSNIAAVRDRVEVIEGDLRDAGTCARACAGVQIVFHHGAMASVPKSMAHPAECHAINAAGTVTLLEAARMAGVKRLVYAASSSAYGEVDSPEPLSEDRAVAPVSPYAVDKLSGELSVRAWFASFGLEAVALRYFNVYGPRQDPEGEYSAVIPKFIARLLRGERPTVFGDGHQSRDFVFIRDVVAANLLASMAPQAPGKVFNIASGTSVTLLDLVGTLSELLGMKIDPDFAPPREGDVKHSSADISLARAVLGYGPKTTLREGLSETLEFFRNQSVGG